MPREPIKTVVATSAGIAELLFSPRFGSPRHATAESVSNLRDWLTGRPDLGGLDLEDPDYLRLIEDARLGEIVDRVDGDRGWPAGGQLRVQGTWPVAFVASSCRFGPTAEAEMAWAAEACGLDLWIESKPGLEVAILAIRGR